MTAMNRRSLLRGVAAAALGCTLIPNVTESAPRIGNELAGPPESLIEKTQWGRRRRRRCWSAGGAECVPGANPPRPVAQGPAAARSTGLGAGGS